MTSLASKLTLSEAALLAGLPQALSLYNLLLSAGKAEARRNDVLRRMADQGFITQSEAAAAIDEPLGVKANGYYSKKRESYFGDYVKQQLIDEYGAKRVQAGGMHIYTTLNLKMQQAARKALMTTWPALTARLDRHGRPGQRRHQGDGLERHLWQFKFNLASQGHYAAGSTFKVMVLMTALRKGVDPNSTSYTSMPLKFNDPTWGPIDAHTYSGSYIGRANLVKATLASDNSIYQQLDLDLGPQAVKETAIDMGIKSPVDALPAAALGGLTKGVTPLEMANAYATIASNGWRNRVSAVRKVCFPEEAGRLRLGKVEKAHRHRAFEDGVTAEATKILKQNVEAGTGTKAQIGCPAAGKTGTVDDFTDAWFVGYTPKLATSVWVGHATDRRTLGPAPRAARSPRRSGAQYMKVAHGKYCGDFPKPKHAFVSTPFFGKYAKTGVKDNKADPSAYQKDPSGAQKLETGKDGKGTGNGSTKYPNDQYQAPPQEAPATTTPPGSRHP